MKGSPAPALPPQKRLARQAAQKTQQEAADQAEKKAALQLEKLQVHWAEQKKQHLEDMKKTFVSTVIATAGKVVTAELDAKKHQKLIDTQLESLLKAL